MELDKELSINDDKLEESTYTENNTTTNHKAATIAEQIRESWETYQIQQSQDTQQDNQEMTPPPTDTATSPP
jgi:hypothetical protein